MMTIQSEIRGAHFRGEEAKNICALMSKGEAVALEREPENQYDPFAIKAMTGNGIHIGYIAKEDAAAIAPQLDEGSLARCVCNGHNGTNKPAVIVVVYGEGDESDVDELLSNLLGA